MIYQFSGYTVPFIIIFDLFLLGLIYLSAKFRTRLDQQFTLGIAIMGFIGLGLFKLLFTVPHSIPSSPVTLKLINDSPFATVYYIGGYRNDYHVFWKDHIIGGSKIQTLDYESYITAGLIIATRFENEWYYTNKKITGGEEAFLELNKSNFIKDDTGRVDRMVSNYRLTEFGNYLSNGLSILFFVALAWRIRRFSVSSKPSWG